MADCVRIGGLCLNAPPQDPWLRPDGTRKLHPDAIVGAENVEPGLYVRHHLQTNGRCNSFASVIVIDAVIKGGTWARAGYPRWDVEERGTLRGHRSEQSLADMGVINYRSSGSCVRAFPETGGWNPSNWVEPIETYMAREGLMWSEVHAKFFRPSTCRLIGAISFGQPELLEKVPLPTYPG